MPAGLSIERMHFVSGLAPIADAFAGTVTSDIVDMTAHRRVIFVLHIGVGATGTSTITVEACDDTSASNTSAIPFWYREVTSGDTEGTLTTATTSGYTTTAGSAKMEIIEADAAELSSSGYGFIRLKAVESVDSPVLGGILIILDAPSYAEEPTATAIT